jgi:hypothetical protein
MPTKARGPLQKDYQRLMRACRKEGVPNLVYHGGGMTIVIPLDGTYLEKLATGQPPAPDVEGGGKPKLVW